jgi:hypothetical protein
MIAEGGVATSGAEGALAKAGPSYAMTRLVSETAYDRNRQSTAAAMQN